MSYQERDLRDFPREVLSLQEIQQLAQTFLNNRQRLFSQSCEMGLDQDFILRQQEQVIVGPFVSPAPLSTTFAGDVQNVNTSLDTGKAITTALSQRGFQARQSLLVELAMTQVPRSGADAMDALIVPKNQRENKKLSLLSQPRRGQVYASVSIDETVLPSEKALFNSWQMFKQRYPEIKRSITKEQADFLLSVIATDLSASFAKGARDGESTYIDFAENFNRTLLSRIDNSLELPILCVDTEYYSPFLTEGIIDIAQFTRKLENIGLFDDSLSYLKVVNPDSGVARILEFDGYENNEIKLRFTPSEGNPLNESDLSNQSILFSELKQMFPYIAPCKELAYVLSFANIVPVVYGSQNSGPDYFPYALARAQVKKLGFEPTMYRIQPQIPSGYQDILTVFDFYNNLLRNK